MKPNTAYAADIVITNGAEGSHVVWINNDVNATVRNATLSLIIYSAAATGRSVYDVETRRFLAGDVGQLDGAVTA
jgi:hypothetical protein